MCELVFVSMSVSVCPHDYAYVRVYLYVCVRIESHLINLSF